MGSKIVKKYGYKFVVDGQEKEVDESRFNDYGGIESYKEDFPGASVRMTSASGKQANIPLSKYDDAVKAGFALSKWEKNDTINEPSENDFAEYFIDDSLTQEQKNINNADTTGAPAMTMEQIEQAVGEAEGGADTTATTEVYPNIPVHAPNREAYKRNLEAWKAKNSMSADDMWASAEDEELRERLNRFDGGAVATHTPLRVEDKDANLQSIRDIVDRNKAVNDIYSDVNKKMLEYGQRDMLGKDRAVQSSVEFNPETKQFQPKYVDSTGGETFNKEEAKATSRAAEEMVRTQNVNDAMAYHFENDDELMSEIDKRIADIEAQGKEYTERRKAAKGQENPSLFERFISSAKDVDNRNKGTHVSPEVVLSEDLNDPEFRNLITQKILLQQAKQRMEASKRKDEGFWGEFIEGGADALVNPETLGGSTFTPIIGSELTKVSRKWERGEKLTEDEQNLVIVAGLLNEAQSKDTALGYDIGDMLGQVLPFIAEVAMNPAQGSSKAITKGVFKYLMRRYGATAIGNKLATNIGKRLTTGALRAAGDIGQASALAGTLQAPKVIGGAGKRMAGTAEYSMGADGELKAKGFTKKEGALEALGKSFATMAIENYTELLGEQFGALAKGFKYLGGKVGKGANKVLPKALTNVAKQTAKKGGEFMRDAAHLLRLDYINAFIKSQGLNKWINANEAFEKQIAFNGLAGEILEEEIAIPLNALLVGDEKIENLADYEHQMQILLGTALMTGGMAALRTPSFAYGKRKASKDYNKATLAAERAIGKEEWEALRDRIDLADNDVLGDEVATIANNSAYNKEQKAAIVNYAEALQKQRGYNLFGDVKQKRGQWDSLYDEGYEAEGDNMGVVVSQLAEARAKVGEVFAIAEDGKLNDPIAYMAKYGGKQGRKLADAIEHDEDLSNEEKAMLLDYAKAEYRYNAMMEGIEDRVDSQLEEDAKAFDDITNKDTGTVMKVLVKGKDGVQFYAKSGNIIYDNTTRAIDGEKTQMANGSPMVVLYDPQARKSIAVSVYDLEKVVENVNADRLKVSMFESRRDALMAAEMQLVDGYATEARASILDRRTQEQKADEANSGYGDNSGNSEAISDTRAEEQKVVETEGQDPNSLTEEQKNIIAPGGQKVVEATGVAERGGKAVDVEDVIAVYNFSKSDAVAARKQPEAYADIITDLEVDRQNAIAWSEGRQGAEQPDNWEYWKEREGLSEPVISDRRTEEQIAPETKEQKAVEAEGAVDVQGIVAEWNAKTGEEVQVANSVEEVANAKARAAITQGVKVKGWYDTRTGEVVVYAPNVKSAEDLVLTIVHENVSHKGLRDTLGEDIYNKMCDKTWEMMDEATRAKYESYAGVNSIKDETERHRAAADEYIASIAEKVEKEQKLTESERSIWSEVLKAIKEFIVKLYGDVKLTEQDIASIIRVSYDRMRARGDIEANSANSGAETKATETAPVVEAPKAEKKAGEDIAKVEDVELKPIGRGKFGNIYDQFRGKPKEALAFLKENKEGDLIGVFYHDEIGDIDLVWGDEKSGLSHINSKHVGDNRSFATLDIAIEHIEDIIKSGDVTFTNGDKVVIKKNDELVTLRKNIRENGKKIADKNWILTAYNEKAADNTRAISVVNKGHAAPTTDFSVSKGSEKVEDNEGKVNKSEVGRYPKELFEGVKDNAMAVRDAKTIFDKYSKVASIEEMIEYRDTLIAWDYLNGSISDAENGLTKITDEEYDSLLEAQRQTDHRLTEIRDDFEKRLEESQKIEAQKAMQERASRMPKPPVKVDAIQEAIDKGDAELESQLLGELQKWVNTDITAEWIPEVENTIHNLETVKSKVKSPSGRYVLDKTLASYKIAQILKKRLKAIKKEESNRATNPNAEVAKASKAKTAKKKAGEDIAKVEEAMKAEKAKRELKTKEDIEKRLAEIREEYEADKEGRDIQTQAEAMVELYGGYANAPKDVKAKIDAQVAKLSARRQELVAEERELEKKLATLAKEQTSTTLDTRTEGQKEDGGYSDNSANSGAVEPYIKTDANLTEAEQKGIEYEINRLADGFGLKPSQLRGVEVKHNADNTAIMVATEWSEGASTARVVELIADNGTSQPDRIWQAYVDGKPASKLMVDEDVNAKDMEELFDERGLLREPTIEDFLKRRGIEFSIADRDKAIGEARMRLEEEGVESDASGSVRFSVRYLPNEKQRKEIIDGVVAVAGVSERKAKQWLESELSLANVMTGVEGVALDYYADDRYNAIKKNSDYPQGTVDFSNICRKRKDFTNIYKQLQAENPNRVFSAEDLETIRQTMIEDGLEVACGLCYVEDRRQLMGEIADSFIKNLKEGTLKPKIQEALKGDTYVPTVAELLEPAGARTLYDAHPSVFEAFTMFNNARGMQSARLFEGYAEYKREILGWNKAKVKSVNNNGGLRIFSFSDFEATHLIDLVQIVLDASSKGVMIQGYTKVPEFARAIRNTGIKLNRSLIPLGDGVKEVNGKLVLVFDPVEGINVNNRNFLNEEDNPNVGNIVIGVNDEQIKIAMADPFIDYIIPFHSNIKKDILAKKKIGNWTNYKDSQREKNAATGRAADNGVNVYTDVLNAAEAEGKPIKNAKQFVKKFLAVCEERGLTPRFAQFLDKGKNGKYVYTKGYEKLLVDFKMFDKNGKILPQQPVKPIFDNAFNAEIINNYVEGSKTDKNLEPTMAKLRERLNLNGTDPDKGSKRFRVEEDDDYSGEGGVRFAVVEDEELIKRLDADEKVIGYRNVVLNEDGTFESPMANSLRSTDRKAKEKTGGFELNKWERSEERPHLVDENGKITLVKPDGKAVEKVDYNPYIHNRLNMVNKQFKQAWERPNLVYIKTEIPLSDLESGYHAEKAKLPVGEHKWNGGNLILSRYDKPVEICDWNDVADDWQASFKKKGINFDIIPPALLPILKERGMKIIRPHKNMGDACNKAYADWAEARGIDTKGFWAEVAKETEEAERAKAEKKAKKEVKKKAESGVRFRFIGEEGAKSMDKKEGTTARMDNLAVAKKMLDEYSYKEVKMATGWEKGMDGKWRYETPDFDQFDINGNLKFVQRHPDYARYRELVKKNHMAMLLNQDPLTEAEQAELDKLKAKWGGAFGKMDNVTTLDAYVQDDDLFNAYPELKSIRVKLTDELPKGTRGRFVRREADDILILDPEEIQGTIYLNSRYPLREVESTLIHEIQHVIQHIEGFAKGGNSEMINEEEQRKYEDAIEFTKERIESHHQLIQEYMEQQGEISDKMNDWYNRHGDEAEFDAEMRALNEKWDAIDKKIDGIRKRIKEDEQWLEDHNKQDFRLGYEGYRALAGEVEARNVQKRRGMTPEERRNSLAEETEDVKRGQQIVIGAKEENSVRFAVREEEDENLVGLHNLTEANLAHAAKMGGLANPSMAVMNRDIATLDNFGDITLIASKALIDKKSGKNAGTWGADAYSPRYPRVEYRLSEKASKELRERGESAGLDSYDISSLEQEIESNGKQYLVGDRKIQKLFDAEGKNGESISEYVDRLYDSLDITERLFKGYTWAGGRRYAKHTLENVSRMMKAEGRAGAEGNFGMGSVRATLTPIFKNIAQIKKSKDRIVSHEDFEKAKESLETRFYELSRLVSIGKYDFAAVERLGEAMLSRNPKEYLEQEYDIEISDEESQEIKTLAADLSVMPTEYFETKFERPVMLEEFAKAVIPNDATAKTRQILADAGLEVVEYDPSVKGDRLRAVREASERSGIRFSVGENEETREMNSKQKVAGKQYNVTEPLNAEPALRFRVSNRQRETIMSERWLGAREDLTEAEKESFIEWLDAQDYDSATTLATARWFANGTIRVPEDMPKVEQAMKVAKIAKIDATSFKSPMELIDQFADIKPKEKAINPDDVSTLSNKKELPNGITVYDVEESQESRENMRKIINTHFGEEANPWCLLQGDGKGNLTKQSAYYWERYGKYPKRVAFQNGKLVAFFASNSEPTWWDRRDSAYTGIPYRYKEDGSDIIGEIFYPSGKPVRRSVYKDGKREGLACVWYSNGQLKSSIEYKDDKRNGLAREWNEDGQPKSSIEYKDDKKDGLAREWYEDGQAKSRTEYKDDKEDGLHISWHKNGKMSFRTEYKDGKRNGESEEWNREGILIHRAKFNDDKLELSEWLDDNGRVYLRTRFKNGKEISNIKDTLLDYGIRFQVDEGEAEGEYVAPWDDAFNAEIENIGNKSYITIGKANDLLKSLGMPKYADIYVSRVNLNKAEEKGIALQDLKNLPSELSEPLAVFGGYADERSVAVLTNLKTGSSGTRYVWVTLVPGVSSIEAKINVVNRPKEGRKGTVYNRKIVDWINEGKMLYVDKEKMASYMADYNSKYKNEDLISATEIVDKFDNPKVVIEIEKKKVVKDPEARKKVTFGEYTAPYYEGESFAEANDRIRRMKTVLDIQLKQMERKRALGKSYDADKLEQLRAELEQLKKDLSYMEAGPKKPQRGHSKEVENIMHNFGDKVTESQKKVIPNILNGIYERAENRKDGRYADYLKKTNKTDVSDAEWYERNKILRSSTNAVANKFITNKNNGLQQSDVIEYAIDNDAEIILTGDNLNALIRFDNGDIYPIDKYGVEYALYLKPEIWQNEMSAEDAKILGAILRGDKKTYVPQGLREYVENKEYGEGDILEVVKEIRDLYSNIFELTEDESEWDASYALKMEDWRRAVADWESKKWGEDAMLDNLLREASGAKADEDVTDEEFKQGLKDEEEKANLSVKEMKGLVKEQIRERRRGIEVSNWQDEMTIYDIKTRTTEEQRKLIPHILEGTYNDPQHRKDKRYADYLAQTGKTDVSSAEWSERKELLNDPSNVENTAITKNQHGLKESDIVEYAVDSDAEILVTGDNLNALIRFPNGDIYTLRKYGVQYLLYIHPEAKQNTMTAEDAELLGMFLRGEAQQYVPQGLREYVEKKEYDEGNTLEVVNEIREWYAEAWSQLEAEGMVYKKEAIEDYVTHIWDLKKSSPTAVTTMQKFLAATAPKALKDINNYVATNTPYVKERAIGSIRDGEAFGLVPKYEDITDIMRDYGHRMNEARENRRLVNFVKGLRVNGMEAIKEEGGRSGGLYIPIKNEALRGYEVHRDVKPVLDVIFGEYHTTDNLFLQKIGHVYDAWGGLLKKINLSLSFFHHGALSETAIAMTNPFYAGKTIFKNILWDAAFKGDVIKWAKTMGDNSETPAYNDVELTKDAVSHFVQLGATSDYATKEVQAITAKFAEWAEGKVGAEELATVLDFWNKGLDKFLWDYLHDGLKIYGYKKLSTEIRAKAEKEGWDEEVLNRALDEAGQLINDTYGGQHWDLLGVSPNALKWARRAFLSPDWTLSTLRQALAPFGYGQMYDDSKFWKKWFKNDPVADVRKRYGRAFWVTAALFFGGIMNGLNAYYRMKDEDEEKKKAEEIRKTRPEYKSPYELAYPDGMRWWDYTMLGNTQGHETHLFGGRYKDGKEQYVRWGKQFRELPELFFGRDGLSFPQPMIDKITGKLNPMINLMSNLSSGYSLNGFQNDFMRDTRGWDREWARLQVLIAAHLPYSIPTDGEKEFKMIDLVMPSTKGFSNWKGIDRFKTAILAGDMDFCDKVYDACVKNGLHADELLDVAIKQIEIDAKRAMVEGVEDLSDAVAQHDKETNPVRKQLLANYIKKQMSAQDYEEITKEEMREKAYLAINGGVSDKNIKLYDKLCNSNDVIEDWRITKGKAGLKKYVDDLKALKEETDDTELIAKYVADNAKYLNQYKQLDKVQGVITSLKKRLGEGKDAEVMTQIREVRKKAFTAKGQEYGKKKKAKAKKEKPAKPIADYGKELSWSESEE